MLVKSAYRESNEVIWHQTEGITREEVDNLKKKTLEDIEKLYDDTNLSKQFNSLKEPFSKEEISFKISILAESIFEAISKIDISEAEFNILNFTWDFSLDPSFSLFFDEDHLSKNPIEYMDLGKDVKWLPWQINIHDYFGKLIAFEEEDGDCLLLDTESFMPLYQAYKLQFNFLLKMAIEEVQEKINFTNKFYYVSEFSTDSILLLNTN